MSPQFFTEDNVALELTFQKLFKKLWPFLWNHKGKVLKCCALVLCFVTIGRLGPLLFGYAVDEGIKNNHLAMIARIALTYFVVETVRVGLSFLQSRYIQHLGNTVLFEIREKLVRHVQHLPATYFDRNPSGRTVTRITNDVFALGELFSQGFAAIFINMIEMVAIFVFLAIISWKMTGILILVLPALICACWYLSRKIRFQFGAAKRKLSSINAFSAESIGGMKVIQVFNKGHQTRELFDGLSKEYRILQLKTVKLFATLWPVIEAFKISSLAIALYYGARLHGENVLTLGELSTYLLSLQGFFNPLKTILERYNQLQNSLASADRVFHLLDESPEIADGAQLPAGRLRGEIEFKNLSFGYYEQGPIVLKNLNLKIAPGKSVALVGRTGSGKTSIISLLQKLYPYQYGEILIDGQSLSGIAPDSLRPRIGVVQQDGFVFAGTIHSNITLDCPGISAERAAWASQQAQCQGLLARHVGAMNAKVEERGLNLSAGERQLLAFARVLAFDPDILILDEATANIDSLSERQIQRATEVATRGRTSVIIAHRLSTILHCDQIVVLDQGEVVETGTHDELIRKKGKYAQLHQSQYLMEASP